MTDKEILMSIKYIMPWDVTAIYEIGDRVIFDNVLMELKEVIDTSGQIIEAFVRAEDDL